VYFNNDDAGYAALNAEELKQELGLGVCPQVVSSRCPV
jgi:hypothetical protein